MCTHTQPHLQAQPRTRLPAACFLLPAEAACSSRPVFLSHVLLENILSRSLLPAALRACSSWCLDWYSRKSPAQPSTTSHADAKPAGYSHKAP